MSEALEPRLLLTLVAVNGTAAADTIHVSDARLSDIQGAVDVLGEDGNDSLTVSDQLDASPVTFYIDNTGAGFFNGNKHLITVEDDVESQVYQFSNNADTIGRHAPASMVPSCRPVPRASLSWGEVIRVSCFKHLKRSTNSGTSN